MLAARGAFAAGKSRVVSSKMCVSSTKVIAPSEVLQRVAARFSRSSNDASGAVSSVQDAQSL